MDRLHELNVSQREAATTLSGPLLILAGAGTGKTRVITYRMAELIRRGTPPERILSVTFTNKAAREMQQRTAALLGRQLRPKPLVCTFHAFCVRLLREEISALGYGRDFVIYDRGDQESAARSALREARIGDRTLRPRDLLARISRWKSAGVRPQSATEYVSDDLDFLAAVAYRRYQTLLRSRDAVDFDDLLLLTKRLFEAEADVLRRHQRRIEQIQIDEYQDTNATQFSLVAALARSHGNLCVVGDDDQSIYSWRGAEVEHILNFQRAFPKAKVVRLEANYRCTGKILEIANRLVRHNQARHQKRLVAQKPSGSAVRFLEFDDETSEAEQIVREIGDLVRRRCLALGDVAILFRTNEQPRPFESEFRRARLPYVVIGGQSFFDRREIRDLLAYLKVLLRPDDEASLLRIINTPARGIGLTTVEKLKSRAVREGTNLWDVIPRASAAGDITTNAVGALEAFHALLNRYRHRLKEHPPSVPDVLSSLIDEIDYRGEICKHYREPQQQQARSAILEQLIDSAKEYVGRTAEPTLAGFLEETALTGRDEESDKEDKISENAVKLMTLHSAKGLEFPRVYLVGLEEGLLPHRRSLDAAGAAVDEERRLLYVGITRAMDHLTLSRAATRTKWGRRTPALPSRFLFEMNENAPNSAVRCG